MRSSARPQPLTVPVAGATPRDRTPALRLSGVCKQFGDEVVVEDLSFDVPQGAVVGLVEAGADGEASATAAAMAAGLLPPDEGQVSAFGVDLWDERARARALVGSLPDDLTATQHMDASQALACFGLTRGLDAETVSRRVAALLVGCGLDATRAMPLRDCSPGVRMRARLAAALMTDPLVLVLDEPFEGIDRASADVIRAVSRGFTAGGGAVLCTASSASSLEVLCDHIGELADGRLTTFRPVRRHRPAVRSRARRARAGAGVAGKWRHGGCA